MKNKKNVFVFAIICITFFIIFNYIFCVSGNNIIRNQNEFVEDIFKKLENYEANIEVIVISNKNENKYNIYQVVDNEYSKLIVNSPENIRGLEIEIKDENFKITNGNQEMTKIYENYKPIINNSLFINSFIDDYKNNETEILEENEDIIIKIELNKENNTYIKSKELYLNKNGMPKKMLIKDDVQNINTSIIYNDIKIK